MGLFSSIKKSLLTKKASAATQRFCPHLEGLESRLVPYTASGNMWPNPQLVTISFMPDGTNLGGASSNLFSTFNAKFGSAAAWQNVILKAAQVWAQQTNLNFAVVPDSGAAEGSGGYQQGDPTMGDIRIGGYNFGSSTLAQTFLPPSINNYSVAGDMEFNTGQTFNINGQNYDLFTVAVHEFGHALGLLHSTVLSSVMYGSYGSVKSALTGDDIAGVRNIYSNNAGRSPDQFGSLNNSFASAANLNGYVNALTSTALVSNLDITTAGEKDYYTLNAPLLTGGTVSISAQSQGLSLLAPTLTVYAADQVTVLGSTSGYGHYGTTLTLNLTNKIAAGQQFYVKVGGADSTAFGTGAYALTMSFAGLPLPAVPLPNTQVVNGSPLSGGGGCASSDSQEFHVTNPADATQTDDPGQTVASQPNGMFVATWAVNTFDGSGWAVDAQMYDSGGAPIGPAFQVNTTSTGQQMYPAVAASANGDFVVTWSSNGQDGSGWGVYAQLFGPNGNPLGGEFQVNTTTAGDQMDSAAAMDANGNFVITWQSQDPVTGIWNIYAQRYDAGATPVGNEFQVNPATGSDNTSARVAMDNAGDTVVIWSSYGQDGSGWGVYGQRFDSNGNALGGEFQVNTTTAGDQMYPDVAMNQYGQFAVTWSSNGQDGSGWGVYLQEYDATGAPIGGETRANTTTAGDQMNSSVALDPEGDFMVTWQSNAGGQTGSKPIVQLGAGGLSLVTTALTTTTTLSGVTQVVSGQDGATGWNIYAQQFDDSGNPLGSEFRVNTTVQGNQTNASITMDALGTIVVMWTNTNTSGNGAVMGQRYVVGADSLDAPASGAVNDGGHALGLRLSDLTERADRADGGVNGNLGWSGLDHDLIDQVLASLADSAPTGRSALAPDAPGSIPGLDRADAGLDAALEGAGLGDTLNAA